MTLHWSLLRAFAAVAEHGGFSSAARALDLSQPAVSRAVRELELACGVELIERSPAGIRVTSAGEVLLRDAREVVGAMHAADNTVSELRGLRRGRLHIGASTTIAAYVLPEMLGAFLKQHPGVDVRLDTAHTRGVQEMLLDYVLDIALTEAPVAHPRIVSRRWLSDRLVPVAASGHPLSKQRRIPAAALDNELLLLREPQSGTGEIVRAGLAASGVHPRQTMVIDGPEAIKQIAAYGPGIAIVSAYTVTEQIALGRLVVLDIPSVKIERPFFRLSLAHRRPGPAVRAFDALLDRARKAPAVRS